MVAKPETVNDLVFVRQIRTNLIAEFRGVPISTREDIVVINETKNIHPKSLPDSLKRPLVYTDAAQRDAALRPENC